MSNKKITKSPHPNAKIISTLFIYLLLIIIILLLLISATFIDHIHHITDIILF